MPEVPRMVSHMHFLEPDNLADMVAGMAVDMVVGIVFLIPWFVPEGKQQEGYASSSQKKRRNYNECH
jgi:hypothetical protein